MYLDCSVKIPEIKGKITRKKKKDTVYIDYEYGRVYLPEKKYTIPKRTTIGKQMKDDPEMMIPNENYVKHFSDRELPEEKNHSKRSYCLKAGAYVVIKKIMEEYKLPELLGRHFSRKDLGLFLDLAAYSIVCENNAGQYYPDYAYNHPLFTDGMRIYSDSKVSDFLNSITENQSVGFLNDWNETRDHREKIYISYDSTNKKCQAGDIEMVEFGHARKDLRLPIINYSIAYDIKNKEPLFYEDYPGSIVDVSQLQFMLEKAKGYGYRKVGFILDRGYFSKENIQYMDRCGYDFVIMVKGMASLVNTLVLNAKGTFEESWKCCVKEYNVYGTTVKERLFASDENDRYFHIFFSDGKRAVERTALKTKLEQLAKTLEKNKGRQVEFGEGYKHYFELFYDKEGVFLCAREREEAIERELKLCGYFAIVTSRKMTAKEAISLYKSRDASEKLFRGDKSYLGNKSLRVYSDESASAKIFIEFIALIIRNKLYTQLKEEVEETEKKANYMTVPDAIKELEKIEMIRLSDGKYRLSHAVTATQKAILKAFKLDAAYVKYAANEISKEM